MSLWYAETSRQNDFNSWWHFHKSAQTKLHKFHAACLCHQNENGISERFRRSSEVSKFEIRAQKKRNLNVFSFFQFKKTNAVGWGCFGGLGCLALSVQRVHKTLSSLSTSHCALSFISVSVHCAGPYVSKAWLTALLHGLPVQVYICIFEDNGSQVFVTALYCTRFYDVFLCHP